MQQVDIFLVVSSRTPGKTKGAWYKYILVCNGHALTEKESCSETTGHRLALACAIAALKRMRRPALITIHTDCNYLAEGRGQLAQWKDNGWTRPGGKELKNADLWQQLDVLLQPHVSRIKVESMEPYAET